MRKISFSILFVFFWGILNAQDLVEWRGPNRSGIYADKGLLTVWPENGPELLLEIEGIGNGLSSPIVYHDTIYVTGTKDTVNFITAYDQKGKLLWRKNFGRPSTQSYSDNRCTPTIENNRIFLVGGTGELICLNAMNGDIFWSKNPHKDYNGKYMSYGEVESTLLTDKSALYVTGGNETTMVALDKQNGNLMWKSKSVGGSKSYASASLIERNGLHIALVQTSEFLVGIDSSNGEILWTHNISQYHGCHSSRYV